MGKYMNTDNLVDVLNALILRGRKTVEPGGKPLKTGEKELLLT